MLKDVSLKDLSNMNRARRQITFEYKNSRISRKQNDYSLEKKLLLDQKFEIKMSKIIKHNRELLTQNSILSMRLAQQLKQQYKFPKQFNDYEVNKKYKQLSTNYYLGRNKSQNEYQNEIRYLEIQNQKFISSNNDLKLQRDQNLKKIQNLTIQIQQMSSQQQKKITDLIQKLQALQNLLSQSQKTILQLQKKNNINQQQLNANINNLKQENKHLKQEVKYYKQNYERDINILRQENQKKQLEIIYIQKITEQQLERKERQIEEISLKIRYKKQQQENQAINVIQILERQKQELQQNEKELLQKYKKLERQFIALKKQKSKQQQKNLGTNQKKQTSKTDIAPNNLEKFKAILLKKQSQIEELNDQIEELRQTNARLKRRNEELCVKYQKQTGKTVNINRIIQVQKQNKSCNQHDEMDLESSSNSSAQKRIQMFGDEISCNNKKSFVLKQNQFNFQNISI